MHARQPRLLPDTQPIVDRLGVPFFRAIPPRPGVYYLKDQDRKLLYIGKALNLRRRLGQYRIANADRFPRRLLRMLHRVHHIDWELCEDERKALERERDLLFELKPPFNRAETWRGLPRYLGWHWHPQGLHLEMTTHEPGCSQAMGPGGSRLMRTHAALARLLWVCWNRERGYCGLPHAWLRGAIPPAVFLHSPASARPSLEECGERLKAYAEEEREPLLEWLRENLGGLEHPFEKAAAAADLEHLE